MLHVSPNTLYATCRHYDIITTPRSGNPRPSHFSLLHFTFFCPRATIIVVILASIWLSCPYLLEPQNPPWLCAFTRHGPVEHASLRFASPSSSRHDARRSLLRTHSRHPSRRRASRLLLALSCHIRMLHKSCDFPRPSFPLRRHCSTILCQTTSSNIIAKENYSTPKIYTRPFSSVTAH
ncbi:hypothetical protein BV22DRAFT_865148 [Leucogyrophana mollusca]|uniref:Uncharacterized protein n=1 Tax=Leucogyrophana mollusca TaxID=85980 RepID=A0ACB8B1B6_9AGAM|nr:hypothetical protein BV22DRAFT_865148 [Leucogyrophana mollusca]